MSMPWPEGRRQISREEYDLRWDILTNRKKMSKRKFAKTIAEIRKRTRKP